MAKDKWVNGQVPLLISAFFLLILDGAHLGVMESISLESFLNLWVTQWLSKPQGTNGEVLENHLKSGQLTKIPKKQKKLELNIQRSKCDS